MENQEMNSNGYQDDEITLKELILKVKEYYAEVKRKWWVLVLFCIPFLSWQLYKAFTTPITYKASLTFMVDDEKAAGMGGIGAILGNFGLGDSKSNLDKVLALSKSMHIISNALFEKSKIDGKVDYLANHLILCENLHQTIWSNAPNSNKPIFLQEFIFSNDSISSFSRQENAALKSLYEYLIGGEKSKGVFSSEFDKKSGILTLTVFTQSEELTIELLKVIYDKLGSYFISSSIERGQITHKILQEKADSIKSLLNGTEYQAARFKDMNNMLLRNTDQLPLERHARNKALYSLMYAEAIKNLELADFSLKSNTPFIQLLDEPIPPIEGIKHSKLKAIAIGLIVGLLIGTVFITALYIYKNTIL